MFYPKLGKARNYTVNIPRLNGGLNEGVSAELIYDNQLSDVKNMWFKDSALKTRPALVGVGGGSLYPVKPAEVSVYDSGRLGSFVAHNTESTSSNGMSIRFFRDDGEPIRAEFNTVLPTSDGYSPAPWLASANSSVRSDIPAHDSIVFIGAKEAGGKYYGAIVAASAPETGDSADVPPYIPTIVLGGKPMPEGAEEVTGINFEPSNMLTGGFKCKYTTDGTGVIYSLPKRDLDREDITVEYINRNGTTVVHTIPVSGSTENVVKESTVNPTDSLKAVVDLMLGRIWFEDSGGAKKPIEKSEIVNNLTIKASKNNNDSAHKIYGMKFSTWFGGSSSSLTTGTRLFAAGNEDFPNLVCWSALNDPTYFPDVNYTYVGEDTNYITGFGKQSDLLVIFKDREIYCTHYGGGYKITAGDLQEQRQIDTESARAIFPMIQLHPEIGCDCPETIRLCRNRLVWVTSEGEVYGLFTTGQYSERNVRKLSDAIEPSIKILPAEIRKKASAATYENNYLLLIGNRIFAMDFSSNGFIYFGSYSTDEKANKSIMWHKWTLYGESEPYLQAVNVNGKTLISKIEAFEGAYYPTLYSFDETKEKDSTAFSVNPLGFFSFTDDGGDIPCMLQTKVYDFGASNRLKRINPFYLKITGAKGAKLNLTYLSGNKGHLDAFHPIMTGKSLLEVKPMRISCNAVRVYDFGIRIESTGRVEVGDIILNYA